MKHYHSSCPCLGGPAVHNVTEKDALDDWSPPTDARLIGGVCCRPQSPALHFTAVSKVVFLRAALAWGAACVCMLEYEGHYNPLKL